MEQKFNVDVVSRFPKLTIWFKKTKYVFKNGKLAISFDSKSDYDDFVAFAHEPQIASLMRITSKANAEKVAQIHASAAAPSGLKIGAQTTQGEIPGFKPQADPLAPAMIAALAESDEELKAKPDEDEEPAEGSADGNSSAAASSASPQLNSFIPKGTKPNV